MIRQTGISVLMLTAHVALAAPSPGDFHLTRIDTPVLVGEVPLSAQVAPAAGTVERWGLLNGQRIARNVTRATLTPVLPKPGHETGAAVIVAPGGAFMSLSMDSEGLDVAQRLAGRGIAAFVLKYRLERTPDDESAFLAAIGARFAQAAKGGPVDLPSAVDSTSEDALQALRVVRDGAARWHIDPVRVGMIGFSAGAMTAMRASLAPSPQDRPAFLGYIYGPMEGREVPSDAPPAFVAIALDDGLFGHRGFGIVESWQRAGRPVELHGYERGDHGFGLGRRGTTTTLMFDEFVAWLDARGLLARTHR